MVVLNSVINFFETIAPRSLQESYDNSGLIIGDPDQELTGILISLDCTEKVIDEAITKKANLVISHHPILFKGVKSLTGKNYVERTILKAIRNNIAIYALHTNLDNIISGVNNKLAERIGLSDTQILAPMRNLQKLVTFIPSENTPKVLAALHEVGAGNIGNYSECSFSVNGKGRFKPSEAANPVIGTNNKLAIVEEDRVEVMFPNYLRPAIIANLKEIHPYEEVAYYITDLENINQDHGAGMIGTLSHSMGVDDFLEHLKIKLNLECIKYTPFSKKISKVALCGGAGSFLLNAARQQGADAFITGDVKYHEFFDAENVLMFCDIGHYESEVGTKELLYDMLTKKFTNFALHLSECVTNPIKYYK